MTQSANGALKHLAGPELFESRATRDGRYLVGYGGREVMPSRWSTVVAMPCAARRLTLLAV